MRRFVLALFLFLVLPVAPGLAEPGGEASSRILSLEEAILLALENNFSLIGRQIRLADAEEAIAAARARFETTQELSANVREYGSGNDSRVQESRVSATTGREFRSGTSADLTAGLTRDDSVADDPWGASLSLSIRQALLEGRSQEVNEAAENRARRQRDIEEVRLDAEILAVLAGTESLYWNLSFQQARRDVLTLSLQIAEDLLEENRQRRDLGLATDVDVLRAESGVAVRREALIQLEQQIGDASDRLLAQLGILADPGSPTLLVVADLPEPAPPDFDLAGLHAAALAFDPELRILEQTREIREIELAVARDSALPELDFVASGALRGDDAEAPGAFDSAFRGDRDSWSVGIQVAFPWSRTSDRARSARASLGVTLVEVDTEGRGMDLLADLRRQWRAVQTSRQLLEVRQLTVRLREQTFAEEQARFEEGLSIFRDVTREQEELDLALLDLLATRLNLLEATIRTEQLAGTLAERHGLELDELSARLRPSLP